MSGAWRAERMLLHIGAPKAGGTSVQHAFAANRKRLRAAGVLYPRALGEIAHAPLAAAVARPWRRDALARAQRTLGWGDKARRLRDLAAALRREVDEARPRVIAVSSEHLFAGVAGRLELRRLRRFLAPFAERIEVLVHLRRPDLALFSAWRHGWRVGGEADFVPPARLRLDDPRRYHRRLSPWVRAFGRDAVAALPFEARAFALGDVARDALRRAGAPDWETLPLTPRNAALCAPRAEFARMLNARVPRWSGAAANPLRGDLDLALSEAPALGPAPRLAARDARAILALCADDLARLARDFGDGGPFFRDPVEEAAEPDALLDLEGAADVAAALWTRQRERERRLRARLAAAEARAGPPNREKRLNSGA